MNDVTTSTGDSRDIIELKSDVKHVIADLQKLSHDINGDGRIGITDRVIRLEQKIWVVWGLGVIICTMITSIAAYLIIAAIKSGLK